MRKVRLSAIEEAAASRPQGYLDDVLSYVSRRDGPHVFFQTNDYFMLKEKYSPDPDLPRTGPGKWLHKILSWFGIEFRRECKCRARVIQMNKWGCDECLSHMDEICGWLREEAAARGLPYLDVAGKMLVRMAVAFARRESSRVGKT